MLCLSWWLLVPSVPAFGDNSGFTLFQQLLQLLWSLWKTNPAQNSALDGPGLPASPGWGKPLLILKIAAVVISNPSGSGFRDINRCQAQSGQLRLEMSQERGKKNHINSTKNGSEDGRSRGVGVSTLPIFGREMQPSGKVLKIGFLKNFPAEKLSKFRKI